MKLKPIGEYVIIAPDKAPEKTEGGLYIPESKEPAQTGVVVAAAEKASVKEGDRVLFGKYSGSEHMLGSQKLIIVKEDAILTILEGE